MAGGTRRKMTRRSPEPRRNEARDMFTPSLIARRGRAPRVLPTRAPKEGRTPSRAASECRRLKAAKPGHRRVGHKPYRPQLAPSGRAVVVPGHPGHRGSVEGTPAGTTEVLGRIWQIQGEGSSIRTRAKGRVGCGFRWADRRSGPAGRDGQGVTTLFQRQTIERGTSGVKRRFGVPAKQVHNATQTGRWGKALA